MVTHPSDPPENTFQECISEFDTQLSHLTLPRQRNKNCIYKISYGDSPFGSARKCILRIHLRVRHPGESPYSSTNKEFGIYNFYIFSLAELHLRIRLKMSFERSGNPTLLPPMMAEFRRSSHLSSIHSQVRHPVEPLCVIACLSRYAYLFAI